jgi:hypothetical protein
MRSFGAAGYAPGSLEFKIEEEIANMKVSPAAGTYLRRFGVLPSTVT